VAEHDAPSKTPREAARAREQRVGASELRPLQHARHLARRRHAEAGHDEHVVGAERAQVERPVDR
jgi:hypothetical protein